MCQVTEKMGLNVAGRCLLMEFISQDNLVSRKIKDSVLENSKEIVDRCREY